MRGTKFIAFNLIVASIILIFVIGAISVIQINKEKFELTAEDLREREYGVLTDEGTASEFVTFGAFFTTDLDGDGYAEKRLGTCKQIGTTDTLYFELAVNDNGYLRDGKITITNQNFTNKMNVLKDSMLKQNYISDDVKIIEFNRIDAGSNEFLSGKISSAVRNQNEYSKVVSVRLTGTHVSDPDENNNNQVTETQIDKTINLTVDWYGEAEAYISGNYKECYLENYSKPYIELVRAYEEKERPITFTINTKELKRELIPNKNVITVAIPELYGSYPTRVEAVNGEYDENTHILTITRNDNSYSKQISVTVVYPQTAYNQLTEGKSLVFGLTSYYECYNNPNDEFENPFITEVATGTTSVYFNVITPPTDTKGVRTELRILDKEKIDDVSYLSKQKLLDAFNVDEDNIENMAYTVEWTTKLRTDAAPGTYAITVKDKETNDGDLVDGQGMVDYINNKGIYFRNNRLIPQGATISIYNAQTDELIKEFSYEEVNLYNEAHPYYYETPVARIRAEISKTPKYEENDEVVNLDYTENNNVWYNSQLYSGLQNKFLPHYYSENGKNYLFFTEEELANWKIDENNTVDVYDSWNQELIKTFTYEEMLQYNRNNPYYVSDKSYWFDINTVVTGPKDGNQDQFRVETSGYSDYSYNAGYVYFRQEEIERCGITEQNTVKVYNAVTGSLIKEFTYDEMLLYTASNKYLATKTLYYYFLVTTKINGPKTYGLSFSLTNSSEDLVAELKESDTNRILKTFTYEELEQYNGNIEYIGNNNPNNIFGQDDIYYFKSEVPTTVEFYHNKPSSESSEIIVKTPLIMTEYELKIYSIKEIDSKKIKEDFNLNQVNAFTKLETNAKSIVNEVNWQMSARDSARLKAEENIARLSVSGGAFDTTKVNEEQRDISISIPGTTTSRKWKNGIFLVKIPSQIAKLDINNVTSSKEDVEVLGWSKERIGDNDFIKVITGNEVAQKGITFTIDTDMLINPMAGAGEANFELYAYNEDHNVYVESIRDIYDINGNGNLSEDVGYATYSVDIIAPSSFATVQTISNYNNEGSITVAPNIAEIKSGVTTAKVNIQIANNYSSNTENIVILGRVPVAGSLGSEFSVQMKSEGINIPTELENKAVVYYSEKVDATNAVNETVNGWKLKENTDFTKVKSYLIVINDTVISTGTEYAFDYDIEIPSNIELNKKAFGNHIVYFDLYTDGGKLPITLNPRKVGIRIVKYFDFDITKLKEETDLTVKGAKYQLKEISDSEDEEDVLNRILISNSEGKLTLQGLRVNQEYSFKEIQAPKDYELNEEIIKFKIVEENGQLNIVYSEDTEAQFKAGATVIDNALKAVVEDTPKVTLTLNKVDSETNEPLDGIIFHVNGKGYITQNGKITIEGLSLGKEYTVKEFYAEGYFLEPEFLFMLYKDNDGNIKVNSRNTAFANAEISNNNEVAQAQVNITFPNDKIETYKIVVEKIDEENNDTKLQGAKFILNRRDLGNATYYTTNSEGTFTIDGLYISKPEKDITGKYILKEEIAPTGYVLNTEEIAFTVNKNAENKLELTIDNAENLTSLKEISINDETKTIILKIQDKPFFKITKTDVETGEPLANVGFVIYELDEFGKVVDFAKSPAGEYIGTKNARGNYVIYTDNNGVITVGLGNGTYKIMEVEFLEGYKNVDNSEVFKITGNSFADHYYEVEGFPTYEHAVEPVHETTATLQINSVEDWVDFANSVNAGNDYSTTKVVLNKSLDFKADSSYANPNDTRFGDINGDGTVEGIKAELNNENGVGCPAVGIYNDNSNSAKPFKGVFDGQGNSISNISIKSGSSAIFEYLENANGNIIIKNFTVAGNSNISSIINEARNSAIVYIENVHNKVELVNGTSMSSGILIHASNIQNLSMKNCSNKCDITRSGHTGGLIGMVAGGAKLIIENSYNTGNVTGDNDQRGGLCGYYSGGLVTIINSYNTGKVEGGAQTGGLIGYVNNAILVNSYNTGNVKNTGETGGLIGFVSHCIDIDNCYNTGNVIGGDSDTGGLLGFASIHIINNSYNKGNVSTQSVGDYIGGIVGRIYQSVQADGIYNTYNEGNIIDNDSEYCGGLVGDIHRGAFNFINCYNSGNISSQGAGDIGGIAGDISYSNMKYCYNVGNLNTKNGYKAGGLFGVKSSGGKIENCYNSGAINCNNVEEVSGIGYASNTQFINCYNTGNINAENTQYGVSGISSGSDSDFTNCYNTGKITGTVGNYVGGIGTYTGKITNCYNTGDIEITSNSGINVGGLSSYGKKNITDSYNLGNIKLIVRNQSSTKRVGGILGGQYGGLKIENCYNTGNIECECEGDGIEVCGITCAAIEINNCYNTGNIRSTGNVTDYVYNYGIGRASDGITNSYTTGNIYNSLEPENAFIGHFGSMGNNSYYLNSAIINTTGDILESKNSDDTPAGVSSEELKSEEFFNRLNVDGNWIRVENQYPKLNIANVENAPRATEINFTNEKEKYDITTEIGINMEGKRSGGTITGDYAEKYFEGGSIKLVETLNYGENLSKDITITPYEKYAIKSIVIDGQEQLVELDNTENYIIPSSMFTHVKQNHHIIVVFEKKTNILSINKVNENNEPLKNVEFKIEQIEDRPEIGEEYGTKQGTYSTSIPDYTKEVTVEGVIGTERPAMEYGFEQIENQYVSDNTGIAYSQAMGYTTINLEGLTGNYKVVVNAEISSWSGYDYGYASITDPSVIKCPNHSDSNGRIFRITGNENANNYEYYLSGGQSYKLWFAYKKDRAPYYYSDIGEDKFKVNSIKVYNSDTNEEVNNAIGEIHNHVPSAYSYTKTGDVYSPSNIGTSGNTANAYIPINLENLQGKYHVVVNADIKGRTSIVLNKNTNAISAGESYPGQLIRVTNNNTFNGTAYSESLNGGETYYVHLSYLTYNTSGDKCNITVKVYEGENKELGFTQTEDGKYKSNNQGYDNTIAHSYVPIDLSNTHGLYTLTVNAESSADYYDYGYIYVTNNTDMPDTNSSNNQLLKKSGTNSAENYVITLDADVENPIYYVHMIYKKDYAGSSGTDTFTINSITLEYDTSDFYEEENINTDANGKFTRALKYGTYVITETQPAEGYELLAEPITHTIGNDTNNNIKVTNSKKKTVTTHYLLNGTGPEFEKPEVELLPSEVQYKSTGEVYITNVRLEIDEYTLAKDEDDEYIVPGNAYGIVENQNIDVYYYYDLVKYPYEIHYFYDNVEDVNEIVTGEEAPGVTVTYQDKNKDGYAFDKAENAPMTISRYADANIINVYYSQILHIRTDILEKNEMMHDGTIVENVKGGFISGDGQEIYETVQIGMANLLPIEIYANEGYEIEKVQINAIDFDYSELVDETGKITIPDHYFKNMQESKNIIVSFKKKTNVKVKYMISNTETSLFEGTDGKDYIEIQGYAGDEFETQSKEFIGYKPALIPITNQDGTPILANGTMFADELTVIYWYDLDNSTIKEKHILEEENETPRVLDEDTHTGQVGTELTVNSKTYRNYELKEGEAISKTETYTKDTEKEIVFKYVRKKTTLKIVYKDTETGEPIEEPKKETTGEPIENPTIIPGKVGLPYTVIREDIDGYTLDETRLPTNEQGTFDIENDPVEYYYIENKYNYVIHHWYEGGEHFEETGTAKKGIQIGYTVREKEGFKFERADKENMIISKNETENVINVYYKKASNVTVIYVDNITEKQIDNPTTPDGKVIDNPTIVTGIIGTPYKIERQKIKGYRLDETKLPTNEEGTFKPEGDTVVYKYIELKEYTVGIVYQLDGKPLEKVKIHATSDKGLNIENYTEGGKLVIDSVESTLDGTIVYKIVETETPNGLKTILPSSDPGKVIVKTGFNAEKNKYEVTAETNGIKGLHVEVNDENGTITIYVDAKKKETPKEIVIDTPTEKTEPVGVVTGDWMWVCIILTYLSLCTLAIAWYKVRQEQYEES